MEDENHHSAQERAVGIDAYISPETRPFKCILKQRYTDFLVNEILPSGRVLHLVNLPEDANRKRKRDAGSVQSVDQDNQSQKKQRADTKEPAAEVVEVEQESEVKDITEAEQDASNDSVAEKKAAAIASISEADRNELNEIFGAPTTESIVNLYASVVAYPDRKPRDHPLVKSEPIQEKSKRTAAHLCVRRIFQSKLETLTVQDQNQQSGPGTTISIKAASPRSGERSENNARNAIDGQRGKQDWSDLGGEYIHFTLYKENKDTMEVLYFIASQLKLAIRNFSFAGTKDRRGVTVQRVAVHRMRKERLQGLSKAARGWRLGGPWEYKRNGLDLGMLQGNEFVITLRDAQFVGEDNSWDVEQRVSFAQKACDTATQRLGEHGFLNYYGLQRFGTHSTGTHVTGMRMLKGDLKGAVDSILAYDPAILPQEEGDGNDQMQNGSNGGLKNLPRDDVSRAVAIHAFVTTGSSQRAFSSLGNRFQAEKGVIMYLAKRDRKTGAKPNENDFQGALMQIQRNLRLMYVHAYQSYVWNTVAGKRWELYGDRVVEGDLVIVGEKEQEEGQTPRPTKPAKEVDQDGEPVIHPSASSANGGEEDDFPVGGSGEDLFARGRPLSKAEAESGRFTIFDIILPLPGFDVEYPSNEVGKFYEDFMASESGGGLDPHKMRRAWKDISLPGGYRKMLARPLGHNVEVEVKAYHKVDEQMVETDLEKLLHAGTSQEAENVASAASEGANGDAAHPETPVESPKLAIVLKMQLGTSQYATMALRELTKGGAMAYQPDFSTNKR